MPAIVRPALTRTIDNEWVVWAHKLARPLKDGFQALRGGTVYAADSIATCLRGAGHAAPQPDCSCGFHALSKPSLGVLLGSSPALGSLAHLEVMLSGRVLALEWLDHDHGVLFRAERQTVMRVEAVTTAVARPLRGVTPSPLSPPADPSGRLARLTGVDPRGAGPRRLRLPGTPARVVGLYDDAGYCAVASRLEASWANPGLSPSEGLRRQIRREGMPLPSEHTLETAPA